MNSKQENLDFDVLGFKVSFKPDHFADQSTAERIVDYVREEASKIKDRVPHLDQGQVAILAALQIASEKVSMEIECKDAINQLQVTADDALKFIEEVSPATN
ncbi:MAG: cell division protein ZapA (FtsZ GTPase activity inhibitor) [Bacteriovoracaceae bacterium]|jgi:cell division protein ZapA (FtsZ GTPase activity inhibitor)